MAVFHRENPFQVEEIGDDYQLSIRLPFLEAEDFSLSKFGDELVIDVGNRRRNIFLPRFARRLGDLRQNLKGRRRAVELAPGDGEAYLILSETARVHGDTVLAEQALEAAGERVLDDSSFHIRLSWNAAHLDQLDPAEAYARIAVALDERNPLAYYQLARVFIMRNQMDDAASVLVQGLEREVLDPSAIRSDTLLAQLADHRALEGVLRR